MKKWMAAAGAYNLLWGLVFGLWPDMLFDWAGMARPNYPELFQCIAMIVGVYGIGYLAAATDPYRHWPVILVGCLGKVFGPIGFLQAALTGRMTWKFGVVNIFNDLIWLIPFFLILRGAWRAYLADPGGEGTVRDQQGRTVEELSNDQPVLLIFLRHFGCTFCREALADLRVQRSRIEAAGVRIAVVHMSPEWTMFRVSRTRNVLSTGALNCGAADGGNCSACGCGCGGPGRCWPTVTASGRWPAMASRCPGRFWC